MSLTCDTLTDADIIAWWRWADCYDDAAVDMLHARGLESVQAPDGPTPEQIAAARRRIADRLNRWRQAAGQDRQP